MERDFEVSMTISKSNKNSEDVLDKEKLRAWIKLLAPVLAAGMLALIGWLATEAYSHLQTTTKLLVTVEDMGKDLKTIKDAIIQRGLK